MTSPIGHDRPKLTIRKQIQDMKDSGIRFALVSEYQAEQYLRNSTYYFKLKSFESNFDRYNNPASDNYKCYINLDFAYLQELATLDMHLRKAVLSMCLDVEHFLKVRILRDIADNELEDGYSIVREFKKQDPNSFSEIEEPKSSNSYSVHIIEKYRNDFPVWAFLEVVSFRPLVSFCDFYYNKYRQKDFKPSTMSHVRFIRNAAAHNNCLLDDLRSSSDFKPSRDITEFVSHIETIGRKARDKKLGNRTVHDFVALLYVYSLLAGPDAKHQQFERLLNLFDDRFLRHREYFKDNTLLTTTFQFVRKIVEFCCEIS